MSTLRRLFVGILSFSCAAAISSLMWLLTIQATLLQPNLVKDWLRESGFYSKILSLNAAATTPDTANQTLLTSTVLQDTLQQTFTPTYMRQQTEGVVDRFYAWLDGQTPSFTFSVPLQEQSSAFVNNLTIALEPQVASLPVCTSATEIQALRCKPPGITNAQFARQIAEQAAAQASFLQQPLTEKSLAQSITTAQAAPTPAATNQLPTYLELLKLLIILLPIIALVSAILLWPLSTDRLLTYKRLLRRICLGSLLTLVLAVLLLYSGSNTTLTMNLTNPVANLMLPVVQKAAIAVGQQLAILSGVITILSATGWIICLSAQRRHQRNLTVAPLAPQTFLPSNKSTKR